MNEYVFYTPELNELSVHEFENCKEAKKQCRIYKTQQVMLPSGYPFIGHYSYRTYYLGRL